MKREDFIKIVAKNTAGLKLNELAELRSELIECMSEDAEELQKMFDILERVNDHQAEICKELMLGMNLEE
jgi:hypothetical protein